MSNLHRRHHPKQKKHLFSVVKNKLAVFQFTVTLTGGSGWRHRKRWTFFWSINLQKFGLILHLPLDMV
jgi:hypothetical protein